MSQFLKFQGSFVTDSLSETNRYRIYESYLEGGSGGASNPYFWPKYQVSYLADDKRIEQKGNPVLHGEYVGPGKIIKGHLIPGTYYSEQKVKPSEIRTGMVLKLVKDDNSDVVAIEILDSQTREVVRIDPNKSIAIL